LESNWTVPHVKKSIVHKDHKWFWRQAATTIITWISNFVAEFPGSLTGFMGLKFDLLHCYAYFLMIFMCLGMIALTHACKFFEDEMCWWQVENSWKIERIFRVEFSNILVESFWGTHFYRKNSPWLFFYLKWDCVSDWQITNLFDAILNRFGTVSPDTVDKIGIKFGHSFWRTMHFKRDWRGKKKLERPSAKRKKEVTAKGGVPLSLKIMNFLQNEKIAENPR